MDTSYMQFLLYVLGAVLIGALIILVIKLIDSVNRVNSILDSVETKMKTVELANAVFTKFKPVDTFIKMINQYNAEMQTLQSAEQINTWCNEKTKGKINKIIDTLTPNDLMVLINAIYFKGKWEKSFDKNMTYKNIFNNFGKTSKELLFIGREDDYLY